MKFLETLVAPYKSYSPFFVLLEIVAALLGIASVIASTRKNILVFPFGIISTAIYVYIYLKMNIPGNMLVNFYYTAMSIYGWWEWQKSETKEESFKAETCTTSDRINMIWLSLFSLLFIIGLYYFQSRIYSFFGVHINTTSFSWSIGSGLDVISTTLFFVGMWLMAKRKIENWILWFIGDILCAILMFTSQLYISGILYVFLTCMAVVGYKSWKKAL